VVRPLRTMLYVPGGEPRKLARVPELGADALILDLEDAVAIGVKAEARKWVAEVIDEHGADRALFVRVNDAGTDMLLDDLQAVVRPGLSGIVLPKVADPEQLRALDAIVTLLEAQRHLAAGSVAVIGIIENAAGVMRVREIAMATPRLRCLSFGAGDLSLDLALPWPRPQGGVGPALLHAKAELALASAAAGLEPPHDGVYPKLRDPDGLRAECEQARELGFFGKHVIHPEQVPIVEEVFQASEDEIAAARRLLDTFEANERAGSAAFQLDGVLVDYPVAERARRLLAAARPASRDTEPEPEPTESALPLAGLRVLDLSSLYAGPLIGTNLADFGAEVIKVEHPRGDDARRWGASRGDVPLWWKVISRNKRLIALDLSTEADRATVAELAGWADVLIENFRPGRLERWGLGWEQLHALNPRLIMVRVTGFGQTGPYRSQPGFGTLAEALSGFAAVTGSPDGPPTLPPFGLADGVAALTGTYATLVALYWRDALGGGQGQQIDISLFEPLFSLLGPQTVEFDQLDIVQRRQGNRSPRTAPRNAYRTRDDGWVVLSAGTQQIANRVAAAIERPDLIDDPRFASPAARRENADAVDALVAEWMARHELGDILDRFAAHEAPIAPVYDIAQIFEDPHYRARDSVITVPDDDLGDLRMQAVVPRLSRTPGSVRWTGASAVGADTDYVLGEVLGRSARLEQS